MKIVLIIVSIICFVIAFKNFADYILTFKDGELSKHRKNLFCNALFTFIGIALIIFINIKFK